MQAIAQEPTAARAFQLQLVEESPKLLDTHLLLGDNHLKGTVRSSQVIEFSTFQGPSDPARIWRRQAKLLDERFAQEDVDKEYEHFRFLQDRFQSR